MPLFSIKKIHYRSSVLNIRIITKIKIIEVINGKNYVFLILPYKYCPIISNNAIIIAM